jgi:monoterpene epsilon-lactone hydrolase
VDRGIRNIALSGDSAGGNLSLVLFSLATAQSASGRVLPVGAVTLSPVTDLALSGASYETRAQADPYLLKSQAAGLPQIVSTISFKMEEKKGPVDMLVVEHVEKGPTVN